MKKINSTLSSLLMLLVFSIYIPFTGQSQTLSATSGSINFENSNHVMNGISLSQDIAGFLSLGIDRMGGQSEIGSLRMTTSSLRFSPLNLNSSAVRPWIGAGVCYSSLTTGVTSTANFADKNSKSDLDLDKQTGITIPISAGLDLQLSDRFNTSFSVSNHLGTQSMFDDPQRVDESKRASTDAIITAFQVGLAFKIITTATRNRAESNSKYAEEMKKYIDQKIPVLLVDTKGSVVTEEEWNNIFPALGDPDTYVLDHDVIVAQYSKSDYKKMIKASEKKTEMYEKNAVESVNASILNHMLHDQKHDNNSNKKDK
ncbi:MAG: hypothetical protein P8L80_08005 [Flavobacteriales bacterium]|nr:hypothetical protein [Flavobacteriales bacterium]